MRRMITVGSALALVLSVGVPASQAAPATGPTAPANPGGAASARGAQTQVTLLTGDRVRVTLLPDGRRAVDVTPAARRGGPPSFLTVERDGDLHVIPDDVRPLVPTRLDPALFNVTELMEQGYDDRSRDALPLIVSTRDGRPGGLPAAAVTKRLESIDSTGVQLDKDRADELGAALADLAKAAGHEATTRSAGPLAGVEKIWLDRRVRMALDHSVGQVGAPAAWQAGLDGSGVTVAVLDTGIDATHPDLAGAVVGERNFTTTPTAADRNGHGTHVASTIAGTGTASGGRYRGMATGVRLLSGKVLDDTGSGLVSWAIDAMEWAAEQGADIVNMSLGATGVDGEPLSAAVDALTREHGTLFVASAGNTGCDECVGHPAAAESALAVGAVDDADELADFSNRGPLPGSYGIKPDVTAPGVGIVAARATGTSLGFPVDDFYTSSAGTSMSAPHVTGAAALLLQARPALRAAELKALLMNTAEPRGELTVYQQGAGRLDVARAIDSPVVATPGSVSFGHFPWPHEGRAPISRTVTYRNLTDADVRLELSVDVATRQGAEPPSGTLTTSDPTVTVPAGGTAAVDLVLDTARGVPGLFGGFLMARAADGSTVRTPVGYHQEQQLVELRVRGIGRDGRPAPGSANIFNVDDGSVNAVRSLDGDPTAPCTEDGYAASTCVRVPLGTYSVLGFVDTMPSDVPAGVTGTPLNRSLVGDPELEVTGDTEVVLDARRATEVLIDTPDHQTKRNLGAALEISFHRVPERGAPVNFGRSMSPGSMLQERLFMQPSARVTTGEFTAYTRWRLEAPQITLDVTKPQRLQLHPQYYPASAFSDFSEQFPMLDGDLHTEIVDAGLGRPADVAAVNLTDKVALIRRSDAIPVVEQSNNAAGAGARLVVIYHDAPGVSADRGPTSARLRVPTTWISHEEGERVRALLARGPVRVAAHGTPTSPYAYDLVYAEDGRIPTDLHYVARTNRLARIDSAVHGQPTGDMTMTNAWFPYLPWQRSSMSQMVPIQGDPRTLVTYLTPGPSVRWLRTVQAPEPPYNYLFGPYEPTEHLRLYSETRAYQAGHHYRRSWFEQPLAPATSPTAPPTRTGDTITVSLSLLDSAGNFGDAATSWFEQGLKTDLRVYRGDAQVAGTTSASAVSFEAEPGAPRYRVEYDVRNDSSWAQVSTRTRGVWTFTSKRPIEGQQRVEPMLGVDYDFDVDLRNRAPRSRERGGPHQIGLTFRYPGGAAPIPVDKITLAVSYDDGRTWQEVRNVRERGGHRYVANLNNGHKPGRFVSVRLSAADRQGNTVQQEIIRAYALP